MLKRYLRYLVGILLIGVSVPMLFQLYSEDVRGGIVSASDSELTELGSLAMKLDTADRDKVRSTLRQLSDTEDLGVSALLKDIWNRRGWFERFRNPEVFDDPAVRLMLARQLVIIGKTDAAEYSAYIKSQAYSQDWVVRANAADALAVVGDFESLELLYKISLTPHRLVALRAIRALEQVAQSGRLNYDRAFGYLNELKGDPQIDDEVVKKEIINASERLLEQNHRATGSNVEEFTAFDKGVYPYQGNLSGLIVQAESGAPQAQHMLGERYLVGIGMAPNFDKARKWLMLSVEQNYAPAKASLAQMYLTGRGVELNRDKAIELLEEAAHQGDTASQKLLESIKSK